MQTGDIGKVFKFSNMTLESLISYDYDIKCWMSFLQYFAMFLWQIQINSRYFHSLSETNSCKTMK